MKEIILISIIFAVSTSYTYAQTWTCGTSSSVQTANSSARTASARALSRSFQITSNKPAQINVYFHIVKNTNGTDAFLMPNLDRIIDSLNRFYRTHHITFRRTGLNFINNTSFLEINVDDRVKEQEDLFRAHQRTDALTFCASRLIPYPKGKPIKENEYIVQIKISKS